MLLVLTGFFIGCDRADQPGFGYGTLTADLQFHGSRAPIGWENVEGSVFTGIASMQVFLKMVLVLFPSKPSVRLHHY